MKLTRKQLLQLRSPNCKWGTAEESEAGFEARFPGGKPIDLAELIKSWLQDKTLTASTLTHCADLARRAAKVTAGGAHLKPRKCLETVLEKLTQKESADAGK